MRIRTAWTVYYYLFILTTDKDLNTSYYSLLMLLVYIYSYVLLSDPAFAFPQVRTGKEAVRHILAFKH